VRAAPKSIRRIGGLIAANDLHGKRQADRADRQTHRVNAKANAIHGRSLFLAESDTVADRNERSRQTGMLQS
jgi:hypothetical protein